MKTDDLTQALIREAKNDEDLQFWLILIQARAVKALAEGKDDV